MGEKSYVSTLNLLNTCVCAQILSLVKNQGTTLVLILNSEILNDLGLGWERHQLPQYSTQTNTPEDRNGIQIWTIYAKFHDQLTCTYFTQLLNRRPPFGTDILASVADLPQYALNIKEIGVHSDGGRSAVQIDLLIKCGLLSNQSAESKRTKKTRSRAYQTTVVLTLTSDLDLVDLRRIPWVNNVALTPLDIM